MFSMFLKQNPRVWGIGSIKREYQWMNKIECWNLVWEKIQPIIFKNKLCMSETILVHYNDGNVVNFSHYIKYKNPNYINIALYSPFFWSSFRWKASNLFLSLSYFWNSRSNSTSLVLSKFSSTNSWMCPSISCAVCFLRGIMYECR